MNTTSSTVEEPVAVKKRFAGFGNNGGAAAIKRLRAMAQREAEIIAKWKSVLDECKKIEAEAATAQREFDANPTPDGVHKLITIRLRAREATEIFGTVDQLVRRGAANREFLSEHKKDLRSLLLTASKHLLAQAREKFDTELKRARETLSKEGFDQDEILQAPKVRAAEWQVEKLERLVESIKQSVEERLWQFSNEILK